MEGKRIRYVDRMKTPPALASGSGDLYAVCTRFASLLHTRARMVGMRDGLARGAWMPGSGREISVTERIQAFA
jgi:hypothetical protein